MIIIANINKFVDKRCFHFFCRCYIIVLSFSFIKDFLPTSKLQNIMYYDTADQCCVYCCFASNPTTKYKVKRKEKFFASKSFCNLVFHVGGFIYFQLIIWESFQMVPLFLVINVQYLHKYFQPHSLVSGQRACEHQIYQHVIVSTMETFIRKAH